MAGRALIQTSGSTKGEMGWNVTRAAGSNEERSMDRPGLGRLRSESGRRRRSNHRHRSDLHPTARASAEIFIGFARLVGIFPRCLGSVAFLWGFLYKAPSIIFFLGQGGRGCFLVPRSGLGPGLLCRFVQLWWWHRWKHLIALSIDAESIIGAGGRSSAIIRANRNENEAAATLSHWVKSISRLKPAINEVLDPSIALDPFLAIRSKRNRVRK